MDAIGVIARVDGQLAPPLLRFVAQKGLEGLMQGAGLMQVRARSAEVFTQGMVYEGVFRAGRLRFA